MPDQVTITGVKPYDGRYPLDLDEQPLTTREWGWIKKHAGYLPLTLTTDAFADPELVTVLAVIAVRRHGTITTGEVAGLVDRLADAPFGTTITIETDDADMRDADEGDADGPPPSSSDEKPSSTGASSPNGSATPDVPPKPTGPRASDTSPSVPATSVS